MDLYFLKPTKLKWVDGRVPPRKFSLCLCMIFLGSAKHLRRHAVRFLMRKGYIVCIHQEVLDLSTKKLGTPGT